MAQRRNLTGDAAVDQRLQEGRDDSKGKLSCPLLRGLAVKGVTLQLGAPTVVDHKLGRKPEGYVITRAQGGAPWFYDEGINDKQIHIQGLANCTVDLWVY